MQHAPLLLDGGEIRSSTAPRLGCPGHVDLPVPRRHHWCLSWVQLYSPGPQRPGTQHCEQHPRCQCSDCVYRDLHLLLRVDMGSWGVDRHWGDFPTADSFKRCWTVDCEQLVVEYGKFARKFLG